MMSKRLNKRQQREAEELAELKAQQENAPKVEEVSEEEEADEEVVNPFAALDAKDVEEEGESAEELEAPASVPNKNKKKKPKKKKQSSAMTPNIDEDASDQATSSTSKPAKGAKSGTKGREDASEGMDEVDRALAELKLKLVRTSCESLPRLTIYGEPSATPGGGSSTGAGPSSESKQFMAFRNLLSLDPKNLDADAELRRFFGSKVIASSAQSGPNRHRTAASSKLRYTISKPKLTYPPATSLAGLGMRELTDDEVDGVYARKGLEMGAQGEKWFTFVHSGQWREVERQFLGAVRSHDPNELMALLQVYPWHVDTLLQMSEVYRLQSDIGAASDFAERALYAFDRCLMPSFSVSTGSSRLDFDRIENRPMFTALHRMISYLGRRGCWVTAFNFAKLLFALDPFGDPHGAAFWLDFLAIKSNNGAWLLSILEHSYTMPAIAALPAYPGMAYSQALALRAQEDAEKSKDETTSNAALQAAMQTFPQVIPLLADKIGASLPNGARSNPLLQVEAGDTDSPSNVIHLLSHIYVARSEALWKEASNLSWFESQVAAALSTLDSHDAKELRSNALAYMQIPRDPIDESLNVPLFICRHVLCSESTSWLGFLPPRITSHPFNAYDPLPPTTAISIYDDDYFNGVRFNGVRTSGRATTGRAEVVDEAMRGGLDVVEQNPANLQIIIAGLRDSTERREFEDMPEGDREDVLRMLLRVTDVGREGEAAQGGGGMPGGFPRQAEDDEADVD